MDISISNPEFRGELTYARANTMRSFVDIEEVTYSVAGTVSVVELVLPQSPSYP